MNLLGGIQGGLDVGRQYDVTAPPIHQGSRIDAAVEPPVSRGVMAGRNIAVSDGRQREEGITLAERAKQIFKRTCVVALGVLLSPVALVAVVGYAASVAVSALGVNQLHAYIAGRNEKVYRENNPDLTELAHPLSDSVIHDVHVCAKLIDHARAAGSPLSSDDMFALVASGERIVDALQNAGRTVPAEAGSPVTVQVGEKTLRIDSSIHTTRAIAWYVMACAAKQTAAAESVVGQNMALQQVPSDVMTSGSFVIKDPDSAVFHFLTSAPTAGDRISTHFNERSTSPRDRLFACFGFDKAVQRGIEDYRGQLPGQGGALLFDQLAGQNGQRDLFIKIESAGCPRLFSVPRGDGTVGGALRNAAEAITGFFHAAERMARHTVNFAASTAPGGGGSAAAAPRMEHVKKGILKETVAEPFSRLAELAVKAGILNEKPAMMKAQLDTYGLPFVEAATQALLSHAQSSATPEAHDVASAATFLLDNIAAEKARLGVISDAYGIERRGAEVHLSFAR